MSLFEDSRYVYRDTFFVFLNNRNRPSADKIQACLAELGPKYETVDVRSVNGDFESITVRSPYDFSAMDIAYVEGEEVLLQIDELLQEFKTMTLTGDDQKKLTEVQSCNARFDIFHFEQVSEDGPEEEFLDPGGLLLVLEKLAHICDGVGLDPQSQTLM